MGFFNTSVPLLKPNLADFPRAWGLQPVLVGSFFSCQRAPGPEGFSTWTPVLQRWDRLPREVVEPPSLDSVQEAWRCGAERHS